MFDICLMWDPTGANEEIELITNEEITITINDEYKDQCDEKIIWVDYKNIVSIMEVGKSVYIDDGLVSCKVVGWCRWRFDGFEMCCCVVF